MTMVSDKVSGATGVGDIRPYMVDEITSHLSYIDGLRKDMEVLSSKVDRLASRIVDAGRDDVSREDLVSLRDMSRKVSLSVVELMKASTRLSLLVQVAESIGVTVMDDKELAPRVKGIVEDPSNGLMFFVDRGEVSFKDPGMEDLLRGLSDNELRDADLGAEYDDLSRQFGEYRKARERMGDPVREDKDGEA